ncbi:neutral/alkaline non-lysosomal ceramidase N-terminal domain-containing protein [candidate division KSB1 bacterium]|nr:neutral/alkaline non-lysosomal ceramidase N-terminal domain-containing protein [candidate division KSB1 bacterium]
MISKISRRLFIVAAILFCLVFILAIVALRPVDHTPYFQTDYYQQTLDRLARISDTLQVPQIGEVLAGYGRANITPSLEAPLAGYSARKGKPAAGVHDSLFAKAIALKSAEKEIVLLGIDGLIVSRNMAQAVMEKVGPAAGLARHQILFGASHSHNGAGSWEDSYLGEIFAGEYNPEIFEFLTNQMASAIQQAHQSLQSGSAGFGSIQLPQFTRNRLVKQHGTIDPELSFALFHQNSGLDLIWGSYSAHATTISWRTREFSGDYPGFFERALEARFPGMAVFFAGGVGSHGPAGKGESFQRAQFIGEALAESLVTPLKTIKMQSSVPILSFGVKVSLPEPHVRISDGWRVAPWLAEFLITERDSYLQLVAVDKNLIIGEPSDFSGELAAQLKDFAFRKGYHLTVTSFNGSYLGYIIPSKYYHLDAYESRLMSFYGPTMGDYIPHLMRRMIEIAIAKIDAAALPQ